MISYNFERKSALLYPLWEQHFINNWHFSHNQRKP